MGPSNQILGLTPVRIILAVCLLAFLFLNPSNLFRTSYCTVVVDCNGQLLSAHIADDGQWRFPMVDSVPEKFKTCLLLFEDEYFYQHPGINPWAIGRSAWQNVSKRRIVSGGSTLTMQTVRLANPSARTVWAKLRESVIALRLEFHYSKDEILQLYASHAPFGGNVVGIEAASWRYFGVPAHRLSWAESATLAVLPNAPSLVHTNRNRALLKAKRDRLLRKLFRKGVIDEMELALSLDEPVVDHPAPMPQLAPHVLDGFLKSSADELHPTSIDGAMQKQANEVVNRHGRMLAQNQIFNAAALVIDNRTAQVKAYVGNTDGNGQTSNGHNVDVARSARSSGSILKPFLYAAALQEGLITPQCLLADVPTYYTDFSPQNYQRSFDGAVRADEALSRSLNIPAVRLMNDYGTDRFLQFLRKIGLTTLTRSADNYGLSLILGGGETSLWDLAGAYCSMARILGRYEKNGFGYCDADFVPLTLDPDTTARRPSQCSPAFRYMSASAVWFTFKALTNVQRPPEEDGWESFSGSRRIAWKTGTSFGFRDAWAIGVTPQYTVAVWVGNANGQGRPGIMGGTAASPIMFDLFRLLPSTSWFDEPYEDFVKETVCRHSGFLASGICEAVDTVFLPRISGTFPVCPYHQIVHLDAVGHYRVTEACCAVSEMTHQSRFVLPPLMEWYYRVRNPLYMPLPPFLPGCAGSNDQPMEFVYPRPNVALFVPKNLDGRAERVLLRVAHRNPWARLFWHIDDRFVGETQTVHHLEADFTPGWHTITLVDEEGNKLARRIQCVNRM